MKRLGALTAAMINHALGDPLNDTDTKPKKETARQSLLRVLGDARRPIAVHELEIIGHSQNALATEISDMAREGILAGNYRAGFRFKEWVLATPSKTL